MKKEIPLLIGSIALCLGAGFFGSFATMSSVDTWFTTLVKPSFNPPSWIFGPVWTVLYILMGISLYRVWRLGWKNNHVRLAVIFFLVHLVVNVLWSIVFFGAHQIGLALALILFLWLCILVLVSTFWHHDRWAAALLVPYLLWVTFATVLNYAFFMLN
jgi:translocator protein